MDNKNLRFLQNKITNDVAVTSRYIGVGIPTVNNKVYYARININKGTILKYTFTNEIAAANCYNYLYNKYSYYDMIPLTNDVPYYMPPEEFIKYSTNPERLYSEIYGTDPNLKIMAMKKKVPFDELLKPLATKVIIPGRPLAIKAFPRQGQLPPGSQSIIPPQQPVQQQYELMADFVDPNTRNNVTIDPVIQKSMDIMRQYQAVHNQNI